MLSDLFLKAKITVKSAPQAYLGVPLCPLAQAVLYVGQEGGIK